MKFAWPDLLRNLFCSRLSRDAVPCLAQSLKLYFNSCSLLQDPLVFKGVVFNEMKGVYSSPDSMNARKTQQALFPENTYGDDSGGDPVAIPDLTFEEFKSFHERYASPCAAEVMLLCSASSAFWQQHCSDKNCKGCTLC